MHTASQPPEGAISTPAVDDAVRLLAVVTELVAQTRDLDPGRITVSLDSRIDRELGIDSLGRAELTLRLEREFDARFPEALVLAAETPRDLLRAVAARRARSADAPSPAAVTAPDIGGDALAPESCATLVDLLDWHLAAHPGRRHITLLEDGEREVPITFADLSAGTNAVAAGLQLRGVQQGQAVAIMLPTTTEFFFAFFGALRIGAVPVPMYPPSRWDRIEDHLRRQAGILRNCEAPLLVTVEAARPLAHLLRGHAPGLATIATARELGADGGEPARPTIRANDIAFLQYTSGSTGNPKGVVLTHANLLANLRAIGRVSDPGPGDVFVSWLPLYHDMGLIGAWFGSLMYSVHLVVMPPTAFLARPVRWLTTLSRWRATITAAPNSAYEICASKIDDRDLAGVDLSSLRWAVNGAEAIDPDTIERFVSRFARFGLRPGAMAPVYGLAEAAVGLAFPPLGRPPRFDRVDRRALSLDGRATPAAADDPSPARFVACGVPLTGHEIRVIDGSRRELPERIEGRIEFRGPSSTSGYFRNPEATRALFRDGWLDTGDIGYIAEGELFITSRAKDLIKRGGHNIHPSELEEAVGGLPGVRRGCVAVIGVPDARTGSERVVVVAETRNPGPDSADRLRAEINRLADALIGGPADEVVLAPPHTVLKTSSGKIRRAATRDLHLGRHGAQVPVWRQFASLTVTAAHGQIRRAVRRVIALAWGAWTWGLAGALGTVALAVAILVPRFAWRVQATRALARALVRGCGLPLLVRGSERLASDAPMIVVANHASYADGVLLFSMLPAGFVFVAKREFDGTLLGWLLERCVPVRFVERFDPRLALEDARATTELARAKSSLVYFPEGTFQRGAGLLPFHMGAFVAAAQSSTAVIPAALRGTRDLLRAGTWLPRRRLVTVSFCEAVVATGEEWAAAVDLRDRARAAILERCGEGSL